MCIFTRKFYIYHGSCRHKSNCGFFIRFILTFFLSLFIYQQNIVIYHKICLLIILKSVTGQWCQCLTGMVVILWQTNWIFWSFSRRTNAENVFDKLDTSNVFLSPNKFLFFYLNVNLSNFIIFSCILNMALVISDTLDADLEWNPSSW